MMIKEETTTSGDQMLEWMDSEWFSTARWDLSCMGHFVEEELAPDQSITEIFKSGASSSPTVKVRFLPECSATVVRSGI